MSVHHIAVTGFGTEAAAYERGRPSYPPDAVAWLVDALGIAPGRTVADVAAGTGKFTRLLTPTGASIVAVEPVDGMRRQLAVAVPSAPAIAAAAEALPLAVASLDAITVAQAFHWFDAAAALREFHRVLRPGGRVGLIWNARDRSVAWVDALWAIMDSVEKRAPSRDHDAWPASADVFGPWFTPLEQATFRNEQLLTRDEALDRLRSVSHVAALPPEEQARVLDRVRAVLDDDPATAGAEVVSLPYRVDAYWAERR
ncbi:MAG TPA: methyltransferase domain-containing protein [Acidimicrobiia bacterium]|nr:methyltransferase domain-containing protein [Acidimicrobiia bacterium]